MKILVVGGTGFIGREIVSLLNSLNFEIMVMARDCSNQIPSSFIQGNLFEVESYEKNLRSWEPNIVIQAAWVTAKSEYRTSELNQAYSTATTRMAEVSFRAGISHFIALGSSAEYGSPAEDCNATTTPAMPEDEYGVQKLRTFEKLSRIAADHGRRFTWARIFQPYGLSQDPDRLIPTAARKLLAGDAITIDNPDTFLDWVSSRDIAKAISWAISHELPAAIDIGTSEGTSVFALLNEIARQVRADPGLIQRADKIHQVQPKSLKVSPNSPLLRSGWLPKDSLPIALPWALGQ